MKLRQLAHSRAGDKGNTSNISLIAYEARDYDLIARTVTADAVKRHFGAIVTGPVTRYDLTALGALNFVLEGALAGGVTRSLVLDAHGKSLSSLVLDMEIES